MQIFLFSTSPTIYICGMNLLHVNVTKPTFGSLLWCYLDVLYYSIGMLGQPGKNLFTCKVRQFVRRVIDKDASIFIVANEFVHTSIYKIVIIKQ